MSDDQSSPRTARSRSRRGCLALIVAATFVALLWIGSDQLPLMIRLPARFAALGFGVLVAAASAVFILRRFTYRIGGRLALSYFLVGIVPIPLLLVLLVLVGYQLNGFFIGHLYRDALVDTHGDLQQQAETALDGGRVKEQVAVAVYRNGKLITGDDRLPGTFPGWLEDSDFPRFVSFGDDQATIAAVARNDDRASVAVWDGELVKELSRRSGILVALIRSDAEVDSAVGRINLSIGEYDFPLRTSKENVERYRAEFFGVPEEGRVPWLDRPILWWGELGGPLHDFASGEPVADQVAAGLNATPRLSFDRFFSSSAEIEASAWIEFLAVAMMASGVYAVAVLMAAMIVFGVSRAVNRLSRATEAVRHGDFGTRIPVRRRDQVGDLQRSFNAMAGDLENLVATAAQKESLDKELAVARDLQKSLLPAEVPAGEQVEFSTLFEPSAAIGGDFFDIVRLDEERIGVVVADVAGHGLPTGLRMAMFKAALEILITENKPIEAILERLSGMIRSSTEKRYFVTASISIIDFANGTIAVTNAGHPPVYRKRGEQVDEILVTGTALGTLDDTYGRMEAGVEPGDFVVWMSDGLIEAANDDGDMFGYDRIRDALAQPAATAEGVQRNLLSAVRDFTDGRPNDDDSTLVVMRYRNRSRDESDGT